MLSAEFGWNCCIQEVNCHSTGWRARSVGDNHFEESAVHALNPHQILLISPFLTGMASTAYMVTLLRCINFQFYATVENLDTQLTDRRTRFARGRHHLVWQTSKSFFAAERVSFSTRQAIFRDSHPINTRISIAARRKRRG